MTEVLFINTNCSWNKGSAAQVISTTKILQKYIPNANFTLISKFPELDSKQTTKYNIKTVGYSSESQHKHMIFIYHLFTFFIRCIFWKLLNKTHLNANSLWNERYLKEYIKTDIIIDLSGDSFADSMGGISPMNSLGILAGILLKKPVVLFSQSIGPFKKWTLPLAKFCLDRVDLIIVREKITKRYLEAIKIRAPIFLTADCAFILEPASHKRLEDILTKEGIKRDFLIGVSVSIILSNKNNNYITLMAQLTDYMIEQLCARVLFIPHVVMKRNRADRSVAENIYKKIINKDKVKLIMTEYSPEELKGIISICDLFIGARMHSNIAALSTCVPTIAMAWSHKYYGIMHSLGQDEYICDIRTMNLCTLKSKVDKLANNKNDIRKELMSKIKNQKELALLSGKLVKCVLHL